MKTNSPAGIRWAPIAAVCVFAQIFFAPLSFALDLTPPTAAITQPLNNSWVNNLAAVTGTAGDDISVAAVNVSIRRGSDAAYWNGSGWGASLTWLNAGGHPSSWTYSNVPAWVDGSSYTVTAKATDTSGKSSVTSSAFIYDITPPNSGVTTQMDMNTWFDPLWNPLYIYGTASDVPPGKVRAANTVWISIRTRTPPYLCYSNILNDLFLCPSNPYPNDREWFQAGGIIDPAANPAVWSWNISNIVWRTDVEYDLQALAVDEAGNKRPYPGANASDMTFFIPQVSIYHPDTEAGVYNGRYLAMIYGEGVNMRDVAVSVKRLLEPVSWWDNITRSWVHHAVWNWEYAHYNQSFWTNNLLGENVFATNYASYTITAVGYSGAERASVPAQRTVMVDNIAPISRIVSPAAGQSLASFSEVSGTASDVTGVALVEVRIRRLSDGKYWTGATWLTAETWNTATGTGTWSLSGYLPAALTPGASYTITSRATDIARWYGNVESYDAVGNTFTFINIEPPGSVSSLTAAAGATMGTLSLFWRSPGNDGGTGTLGPGSAYYIQYATYSSVSWSTAAAQISISTANVNPGTSQYSTLAGLSANANYYFRLWTKDDGGNYSALSNGATAATLIESPVSVYFDEVSTTSIVASAYAPTPAFTALETGLSGVNVSINGLYTKPWRNGNIWTTKAPMPTARFGLSAGVINGKLYAMGGLDGSGPLNANEEYDPVANTWAVKAVMPTARAHLSAGVIGGKLYAVGGGPNGFGHFNTNEEYDPVSNTWSTKAVMPTARPQLSVGVISSQLYALGGYDADGDGWLNFNEKYDPLSNTWATKAVMPTGRFQLTVGVICGKLYAVGGVSSSFHSNENEEYDPASNTWVTKAAMRTAHTSLSAGVIGGKLYAVGGYDENNIVSSNEEYDPASDTWHTKAPMPTARVLSSVGVIGGKLYVVGGGNPSYLNTNEEYDPGVAGSFTGLTPNTLYTFSAKARNRDGVETGETLGFSTYTLAAVAWSAGPIFTSIFASSITVNWSSGTSVGGFNGPGASYKVQISTALDFSAVLISSTTGNLQFPVTGLLPHSTYYFRVKAANSLGAWGDYLILGPASIAALDTTPPTVVIAEPPAELYQDSPLIVSGTAADNVSVSAVFVRLKNLSANEYWNGSSWVSSAETWLNAAIFPSSWTYSSAPGWVEGSYYTAMAKAVDISGNRSAVYSMNAFTILPVPLSAPALTTANVGSSSITWSWLAVPRATGYRVLGPTGVNISPDLAQGAVSWAETGLLPNTPHTRQLMALNAAGISTSPVVTRYTLAVPPSAVSGAVLSTSSISVSWNVNLNPPGTDFELAYSSVGYSRSAAFNAQVYRTKSASFMLDGLLPFTTYYFSVRALNNAGLASESSNAAPVRTFPLSPSTPLFSNGAVGVSSIVWTWAGVPYGENYRVTGSNGINLSGDLPQDMVSWAETGLLANTQYVRRVIVSNTSGASGSNTVTRYTLAHPPANFSAAAIHLTGASLNWGLNNNPAGTMAEISRSPDGMSYTALISTGSVSFQDGALAGCATYYYRIRNFNGDAVPTSYAGPIQVFIRGTGPMPASGLTATSMPGRRISLSWLPSPGPGLAYYRLYSDGGSGTVDYSSPVAVLSSASTAYITGVLVSSPSYMFALRAADRCGGEESNLRVLASAPALDSLAGVRASIREPHSGKKVAGNRLTVMAEIILGESFRVSGVRFQWKASASPLWLDIAPANANHPNPDADAPYFVHWDVSQLTSGNYDLRAIASDINGHSDTGAPSVTVAVNNGDFDVRENIQGDGRVKKEQVVNNAITSVVQSADVDRSWTTKVNIPSEAVSISTVTLSIVSNPSGAPVQDARLNPVGQVAEINLSNSQHLLSNGREAEIELTYPDADGNGIVDGTGSRAEKLRIFSYDTLTMSWKDDLVSVVDQERRRVIGRTRHFSYFAVFAPGAADPNRACLMYPNPWKPGSGGIFDAGGVTFANLDTGGTVRIFTIAGELVRELDVSAADSRVKVWDGKNSSGSKVASGVYIVRASFNGANKILKLAVER